MSTEIPLYVSARTEGKRGGERILHRDPGCPYLVRFDEPTVATTAQRQDGRLCLLCGDDARAKVRRSARRATRTRRLGTPPVSSFEEWRARQNDQTLGKESPE